MKHQFLEELQIGFLKYCYQNETTCQSTSVTQSHNVHSFIHSFIHLFIHTYIIHTYIIRT